MNSHNRDNWLQDKTSRWTRGKSPHLRIPRLNSTLLPGPWERKVSEPSSDQHMKHLEEPTQHTNKENIGDFKPSSLRWFFMLQKLMKTSHFVSATPTSLLWSFYTCHLGSLWVFRTQIATCVTPCRFLSTAIHQSTREMKPSFSALQRCANPHTPLQPSPSWFSCMGLHHQLPY